jgi:hypothetical protein
VRGNGVPLGEQELQKLLAETVVRHGNPFLARYSWGGDPLSLEKLKVPRVPASLVPNTDGSI